MKKIVVKKGACIGCGACVGTDPDHFEFDDEGLSKVKNNENLDSNELKEAIESCPTAAISLDECECGCDECHCTKDDNCGCNCYEEE